VAIDSSGNAAASLSGYSAKAGLRCYVFTPAYASVSKLIQTINYGATVFAVEGTRRASYEIAKKAYQNLGWYYCGFQTNPYALAGLKTIAYEICEQLNWSPPNWVVFPVGTGSMLVGCWRGFTELQELGWISESPSLLCVQPEGCAPISNAFRNGAKEIRPVNKPASVAEGLLIGHPLRGKWILKALHDSNGWAETVSDVEITQTAKHLARSEGIFVEPSAAASLAGLVKAIEGGHINKNETIVSLLTGTGLKTQKFYSARVQKPLVIQPQIEDLKKALQAHV
jgi:threonine synthase